MKLFIIVSLLVKVWQQHQTRKMFPLELYRLVELEGPRMRVNIRASKN